MKRPRRRWPWLLTLPIGALAVLWIVQSDVVARIAARAIETAVEQAIGEQVTIGRIEVSYLPPHVELQGIVVTHPPTGETVAAARAVRLEPGLDGFRPVLERLELDRPQLSLHLDPDGVRELRGVATAAEKTADTFPWKELWIHDGRFAFDGAGVALELSGIEASPSASSGEPDAPAATDLAIGTFSVHARGIDQQAQDIRIPGVTITPDRFAVPNVDLRFDALRVEGGLAALRDGPLRGDLSLHLDLARLTRSPERPNYVDGVLDVDAELRGTVNAPEIGGALANRGVVIWGGDPLGATGIGDAEGRWRLLLEGPLLQVDPLHMRWGDGDISASAELRLDDMSVKGKVLGEGISLAKILSQTGVVRTPWADFRGDIEIEASGTISPLFIEGSVELNIGRFRVADGPVDDGGELMLNMNGGAVVGGFYFDAKHLVIDGRQVLARNSHGHARADIGFAKWGPLSIDVDMERVDLGILTPVGDADLGGIARVKGWIGGRYDEHISTEGTVSGAGVVVLGMPIADTLTAAVDSPDMLRLHFGDIRARRGETDYRGDFEIHFTSPMFIDTQVHVADGRIPDLAGIWLETPGVEGRVSGTAVLSGEPYHLDGEVSLDLRDVSLWGEKFPVGHATSWMDDGEFTLEALSLQRGEEALLVRGSVARGFALNMEALWDGATLQGLDALAPLALPLTGKLVADAQFGGTLFDPAPRGRIATSGVYFRGQRLADSRLDFRSADGVLAFDGTLVGDSLAVAGSLGMWDDQPYDVRGHFDGFPAHLLYPTAVDGSPITAVLSGDLRLDGHFGDTPTPVDIEGHFPEVAAAWGGHHLAAPEPWDFSVHGRNVQVPTLRLAGDDGTVLTFEGYADAAGDLAFRGEGKVNLDLARAVVPGLEEARGMADVKVEIDDRVDVSLAFSGATVRSSYFPATFESLGAKIEANAYGYTMRDVSAVVGGGRFRSERSVIHASGWIPDRYELAGRLTDGQVQYLDYLPPITGDADLRFDGPADDLLLSGAIDIDRMDFRERIDWESMVLSFQSDRLTGAAPVEGANYFSMDLSVSADDTVHVHNNVADADASARVRIVGDTQRPGMVGEIRAAPGGRMYLHEREFEVTRAELRYVDPYTYDPDLDILLETDVHSHEQDYHVNYAITGPLSDWRTTATADPWLAQADVNALLLFGVTREELERYGGIGTALLTETSDLLAAQYAGKLDLKIVDRWSLVSGVSERGSNVVSSEVRLVAEKEWAGFDVTVEKNLGAGLGTDWYASVERRIVERLYASAYVATRQEGRSLPIGAAYGAEFKLRWEAD